MGRKVTVIPLVPGSHADRLAVVQRHPTGRLKRIDVVEVLGEEAAAAGIQLAFIRYPVALAVVARLVRNVTVVGNGVQVAVEARIAGDLLIVRDAVVVAVQPATARRIGDKDDTRRARDTSGLCTRQWRSVREYDIQREQCGG